MKSGLLAKILVIAVSVTLAGAGAVYWSSTRLFTDTYADALHSRSLAIAQSLKIQLERITLLGIQLDNLAGFERQCKSAVDTYQGIDYAMVVGVNGTMLFHSDPAWQGRKLEVPEISTALKAEADTMVTYRATETPMYAAIAPLKSPAGAMLGAVVIGMSAQHIDERLRRMQTGRVGVAATFIVGGFVVFVLALSYFVIRPIKVLIGSIDDIRADTSNLGRRVPLRSDDEIGVLASAFNGLMQNLQDTTVSKSSLAAAYDALRASEAKYREVVSNANAIILRLGLDGSITYFNEFAERFFGYSAAEILGRPALGTILPEHESGTGRDLGELISRIAAKPEEYAENENENITRDGRRVFVRWANRVILGQDGQPTGVLCIGQDITEKRAIDRELEQHRHHLEELVYSRTAELAAARDAAEAASRAKSIFLANMSHELRTPMNAIMGMTYLAKRRANDPAQIDQLAKVTKASEHLLALINDILDISRIEADELTLEEQDFSLAQILDDAFRMEEEAANVKGLELARRIDPRLPAMVRGDALRIRQILLNYLGNAIKFSDHGRITMSVTLVDGDSHSLLIRLEVADQGIGIGAEQQAGLFRLFTQADQSSTRKYGGSGLGLYISRRIARLMGGDTGVDSEAGRGSRFWATLRLRHAPEGRPDARPASAEAPGELLRRQFAGTQILVAEDEPVSRELALHMLEEVGLAPIAVENGAEAVNRARLDEFALILMDMQMPVMNGLDATQAIRQLPGRAEVPIIAMTANAFDEDRDRCLAAGMNGHVSKPVAPEVLHATLLEWLTKTSSPEPRRPPSRHA